MAGKEFFFSSGLVRGLGRLFFLRVPQMADAGSAPSRLLGSLVREGNGGLFGTSKYPVPENSFILGAVMAKVLQTPGLAESNAVDEIPLAGFSQALKIDGSLNGTVEAPFPGVPNAAGIGVNYGRIREATIEFGEGARKRLIPRDLLVDTYHRLAKDSFNTPDVFFDDDRMVIDQVLLVRKLVVTITSDANFSANFDLKAAETNKLSVGVKYERKSDRSYSVKLDGAHEYLLALGAVEADKFVKH